MKNIIQILAITLFASAMTACGSSMQGASSDSGGSNSSQSADGGGGGTPTTSPANLSQNVDGYVSGGSYDKLQTIQLDAAHGNLDVNLPMGVNMNLMVSQGQLSQLPGVTFSTVLSNDGTAYFQIAIPLKYVLHGVTTLPANTLPNGDPLPLMPATSYPSLAFALNPNQVNGPQVYLYVGVAAIGVYVESSILSCGNLPICVNLTFPIKNQAATKIVGYLSMVMPKTGHTGGFFISTVIPNSVAALLENYIQ